MTTKKMTVMSLLLAIALVIFTLEAQLPPLTSIPGIKLGLANVITLVTLLWFGRKEAFFVLTLRIVITSVFFGGLVNFVYSMTGGILCFTVMAVLVGVLGKKRIWVVSIFGAIAHNIGQVLAAMLITSVWQILMYLPILTVSAVITGAFTGFTAGFAYNKKNLFIGRDIK